MLGRDGGYGTCRISWCACNGGGFVKVSLVFIFSEDVVSYARPYFFFGPRKSGRVLPVLVYHFALTLSHL